MQVADFVSSVTGHDDPSEPPPTSYPAGGTLLDSYMTQYAPSMLLMPGMASNCSQMVWDMNMMPMPMEMHDKTATWAHFQQVESWSAENSAPAVEVSGPPLRVQASTCSVAVQCDIGVQCDLPSESSAKVEMAVQCDAPCDISSPSSGCHMCKHCGRVPAPATTPLSGESTQCEDDNSPTPELLSEAWGPANDWAWDQCSLDEEPCPDSKIGQLQLKFKEDRLQRFLPPAPSMPPPLPPRKAGQTISGKAKQEVQSYPTTPTTASSADSAAATSPSADDMSSGVEAPRVNVMQSAQDCLAEKLQRKLAKLQRRKRGQEADRFEDQEQQTKDESLQLDEQISSSSTLAAQQQQQQQTTASATQKASATATVVPEQGRLQRRQCKSKETRSVAVTGLQTLQLGNEEAAASGKVQSAKTRSAAKAQASSKKRLRLRKLGSTTFSGWRLRIAVGILAAVPVLGHTLAMAWARTSQKETVVHLPAAGTSNAWAATRPEHAPSQVRERTVAAVVRAHHAEVARGEAVAQQVQAKVKQIKRHRQLQRAQHEYQEEQERHELQRQTADYMYWQQAQMMQRLRKQTDAQTTQSNAQQPSLRKHRTGASEQLIRLAQQKSRQLENERLQQRWQAHQQRPLSTFQVLRAQAERRLAEASLRARSSQ